MDKGEIMNRQELLKALKATTPGLAKGDSLLPGSDSIAFHNGMVQSYNDALSVSYPLDCGVEVVVKAAEMIKALENMKGETVEISLDSQSLKISSGRSRLSMRMLENPPTLGMLDALGLEDQDWDELPSNFMEALALCLPSTCRDMARGALAGIRVEPGCMLSTDNFRATWVDLGWRLAGITIPQPAAAQLVRLQGMTHVAVGQAWVHFLSKDGAVFSSRLLATEYPTDGLKQEFPETSGEPYQFPDGMSEAVSRAGILSSLLDDNTDFISISEHNGMLLVRGERSCGTIDEEIPIQSGTWPAGVSINIQPGHLLEIMARCGTFTMEGRLVHFHGKGFNHIMVTIIKD